MSKLNKLLLLILFSLIPIQVVAIGTNPTMVPIISYLLSDSTSTSVGGEEVFISETVTHNGINYKTVKSSYTNKIWLDRNLGANRVCTSYDDEQCYGDYYQWGRDADGHEKSDSSTTNARETIITPGHSYFIVNNLDPYDWTKNQIQDSNDVDDNGVLRSEKWSKTDGSSICPVGFRVPTMDEFIAENLQNSEGAFNKLKLPLAGYRYSLMDRVDSWGYVWTSTSYGINSKSVGYGYLSTSASAYETANRAYGFPVRCIQDTTDENSNPSTGDSIYGTIISGTTGRIWLDRNLGASKVSDRSREEFGNRADYTLSQQDSFGDYYQWGRSSDGHEKADSSTTYEKSSEISPGHDKFIATHTSYIANEQIGPDGEIVGDPNYILDEDWTPADREGYMRCAKWNPCPDGFEVPTKEDFDAEGINDRYDAFFKLKLPSSSSRAANDADLGGLGGTYIYPGNRGYYWTRTPRGRHSAYSLNFDFGISYNFLRVTGMNVRCIKSECPNICGLWNVNVNYTTNCGGDFTIAEFHKRDQYDTYELEDIDVKIVPKGNCEYEIDYGSEDFQAALGHESNYSDGRRFIGTLNQDGSMNGSFAFFPAPLFNGVTTAELNFDVDEEPTVTGTIIQHYSWIDEEEGYQTCDEIYTINSSSRD